MEHRTPTRRRNEAIPRYGNLQRQRIAGHRQIFSGRVMVSRSGPPNRSPGTWVTDYRAAEDRRLLLIHGGVNGHHPKLDGAHDRVGTLGSWRPSMPAMVSSRSRTCSAPGSAKTVKSRAKS